MAIGEWRDFGMTEQFTGYRIDGKSIYLRFVLKSDFDEYYAFLQDPESNRLTGTQTVFTHEDVSTWIKKISVIHDDRVDFMIFSKDSDHFLGEVVLNEIDSINRSANIRVGINLQHSSKGYGTEAMMLMLRHGFEKLKLHRIHLGVYAFNPRAIHVYEKIGFQREGILRDDLYLDGEYHDMIMMAILEDEFRGTTTT